MAKYSVLPGQADVRIARTDGRCCIIGEEPREIPEDMERDAIAAGAFTAEQIDNLKARLNGDKVEEVETKEDTSRTEAIHAATVTLINAGNPVDFTSQGKPRKEALELILGFEITGVERDTAFAEVGKV